MASALKGAGSPAQPLDADRPGRFSSLRTMCFRFMPLVSTVGGIVLILLLLLLLWISVQLLSLKAGDKLRFASYYADHMVLQKEPAGAVLWGYGKSYATVTVRLYQESSLVVKKKSQVEGPFKIWKIVLNPMSQGGPYRIEVHQGLRRKTANVVLNDVYFGDVWLCSGQSNMEMGLSQEIVFRIATLLFEQFVELFQMEGRIPSWHSHHIWHKGIPSKEEQQKQFQIFNASKEFEDASKFPLVRVFHVDHDQARQEQQDLTKVALQWFVPAFAHLDHGNSSNISSVCWLFGCYLFETLKYPIGLVQSSWSSSPIETWSSKTALSQCGLSEEFFRRDLNFSKFSNFSESALWNAMIHPLVNMTIRGAIWYQGEANAQMTTDLYNCTFPALIEDWRKTFHQGSEGQTERFFPFGFVQLSPSQRTSDDSYPRIRWHQTADFGYVPNRKMPNTFMAVAVDLGDYHSPYGRVHPRDKRTVAYRLYLGAQAVAYGEKHLIFQGPYPQSVHVVVAEKLINVTFGQKIRLYHLDKKIFEVCCSLANGGCTWKPAPMASSSFFTVTLNNLACLDSVEGLRYAWTEWPCEYKQCPIYNAQMLPTPPFITFSKNYSSWTVS